MTFLLTLGKKKNQCIGPGQKLLIVMQQADILFLLQNFQMGINYHIKDFIIPLSIFSAAAFDPKLWCLRTNTFISFGLRSLHSWLTYID